MWLTLFVFTTMQIVHFSICRSFLLKPEFGSSGMYLGVKLHMTRLHNGAWVWAMSSVKFVHVAVRNYKAHLVNITGVDSD